MRYVALDGTGDAISTPDAPGFSALSDFSVLVTAALDDWTPAALQGLMAHFRGANGVRSWDLAVTTGGLLQSRLSTDGNTLATTATSSAAPTIANGAAICILETRAKAAGEVKFYTAPFPSVAWPPAFSEFTQLGTTVTGVTTGTLFNSTGTLTAGGLDSATVLMAGKVYLARLYSGLYGVTPTLLANMDPSDAGSGTTWVAGTTGETWTLAADAKVLDDTTLRVLNAPSQAVHRASSW